MMNALESTSTRPYLVRALFEWCTDNGLTPYIAVLVDDSVQVPREYVQNGEIVLNISYDATSGLKLGNDFVEFKARFAGVPREIMVPMDRVMAIYARENGQGMAFPVAPLHAVDADEPSQAPSAGASIPAAVPAPTEAPDAAAHTGIQLVPPAGTESKSVDDEPTPPPQPGSGKPRPALKRIK